METVKELKINLDSKGSLKKPIMKLCFELNGEVRVHHFSHENTIYDMMLYYMGHRSPSKKNRRNDSSMCLEDLRIFPEYKHIANEVYINLEADHLDVKFLGGNGFVMKPEQILEAIEQYVEKNEIMKKY